MVIDILRMLEEGKTVGFVHEPEDWKRSHAKECCDSANSKGITQLNYTN